MWFTLSSSWESIATVIRATVEILLIATAIYQIYRLFHATKGAQILLGFLVLLVALAIVIALFKLTVISWIIVQVIAPAAVVGLLVIFQPELRNGLARLGSHPMLSRFIKTKQNEFYEELCKTVASLSHQRHGALLAIERTISLKPQIDTGIEINGKFSEELVSTIFYDKTPLHDGAVILAHDKIIAACCVFPVSARQMQDRSLGLRHRAGLGMAEESDAIIIIVSEETGSISLAHSGKLEARLSEAAFKTRLQELLSNPYAHEKVSDTSLAS